jgi:hypothetical protein
MTYLRVHQHYIAEARSLEADIAEIAEVAQLLTSGASVKEGEPGAKAADALTNPLILADSYWPDCLAISWG